MLTLSHTGLIISVIKSFVYIRVRWRQITRPNLQIAMKKILSNYLVQPWTITRWLNVQKHVTHLHGNELQAKCWTRNQTMPYWQDLFRVCLIGKKTWIRLIHRETFLESGEDKIEIRCKIQRSTNVAIM